jgi:hypothetical protein
MDFPAGGVYTAFPHPSDNGLDFSYGDGKKEKAA